MEATTGHRRAPLLLLPGTLCDERVFAPMLRHLPRRPTTIAALPPLASVDAMAREVLAAAPPRFAVAGLSLGGIVAMRIAALAPGRILGLATIAATARAVPAADLAERRVGAMRAASDLAGHARDTLAPLYAGTRGRGDADRANEVVAMALSVGPAAFLAQTEAALGRADARADLAGIATPALVLGGDADRVCPPERQREIAAALPGARLVLLDGTGHLVPLDDPRRAADALGEWLGRVDRAMVATGEKEMA